LAEIEELLSEANEALRATARQLGPERICASVVVTLFVHDCEYAVIWAGDSRAYLYREGEFRLLTHDHVSHGGRYVTRAIGAENVLQLDVMRGDVRHGDRFVLCNEGLVNAIGDLMLEAAVARRGTATELANGLIDDALIAGASDNVTVLVVDFVG
jgi:type VI secretion system protein ImpM